MQITVRSLSTERNPFTAKNRALRSYRAGLHKNFWRMQFTEKKEQWLYLFGDHVSSEFSNFCEISDKFEIFDVVVG